MSRPYENYRDFLTREIWREHPRDVRIVHDFLVRSIIKGESLDSGPIDETAAIQILDELLPVTETLPTIVEHISTQQR